MARSAPTEDGSAAGDAARTTEPDAEGQHVLIVSGLAGAGKSQAS